MGLTDKLENFMENFMDKIGGAFFRGKIQPVELAKKALLELKRNQIVSISTTYVPNVYEIILKKEDLEDLLLYKDAIIPEIKDYLMSYIKKEDLSLMGELEIEFREGENMEPGKFEIKSTTRKTEKIEEKLEKTIERKPLSTENYLYGKEGPEKGKIFRLVKGINVMGRKEDNQVKISDPEISRAHSVIYIDNNGIWVEDRGSTNGTYLNGQMITQKTPLKAGDQISLGSSVLEFKSGDWKDTA